MRDFRRTMIRAGDLMDVTARIGTERVTFRALVVKVSARLLTLTPTAGYGATTIKLAREDYIGAVPIRLGVGA